MNLKTLENQATHLIVTKGWSRHQVYWKLIHVIDFFEIKIKDSSAISRVADRAVKQAEFLLKGEHNEVL